MVACVYKKLALFRAQNKYLSLHKPDYRSCLQSGNVKITAHTVFTSRGGEGRGGSIHFQRRRLYRSCFGSHLKRGLKGKNSLLLGTNSFLLE